jgi:hypothetical protein
MNDPDDTEYIQCPACGQFSLDPEDDWCFVCEDEHL